MAAPMDSIANEKFENKDRFKIEFKYYKRRKPPPNLGDVIDFEDSEVAKMKQLQLSSNGLTQLYCLKPIEEWQVFTYTSFPGFTFIRNPFYTEYQSYWIKRCLEDYPMKPNVTNLDAHMAISTDFNIWHESIGQRSDTSSFKNTLIHKLRWTTLGYHHDWDTKKYSAEHMTPIPKDMQTLSQYISMALGWNEYKAEAAIINYYNLDSTLAGHTDHSEIDHQSPLISISFGQTALFMLGGPTKETKPITMYLRSGDIVIMEGPARLSYHAVPKILPDSCDIELFNTKPVEPWKCNQDVGTKSESPNAAAISQAILELNQEVAGTLSELDVTDFLDYLKTYRINMNIRRVLPEGHAFPP